MSVFKNAPIIKLRERQNMTVCSRFFHPLSLCVVAPFDLDGVPPRTLSPRPLPTPLGTLAPFREVLAHFAGMSNNHPADHSVVLFKPGFRIRFLPDESKLLSFEALHSKNPSIGSSRKRPKRPVCFVNFL